MVVGGLLPPVLLLLLLQEGLGGPMTYIRPPRLATLAISRWEAKEEMGVPLQGGEVVGYRAGGVRMPQRQH